MRIAARQPFAEARGAVEDDTKISTNYTQISRQGLFDALQSSFWETAVGMQEQQNLALRVLHAGAKGAPAPGWRMEHSDPMRKRNFNCAVPAPAIDDDGVVFCRFILKGAEESR